MSEWQPIATAPKDGRALLVTWIETWPDGNYHIEACRQQGGTWFYCYDGEMPNLPPTHWMPIPEPPK